MKHVSILIPRGHTSLANIEGSHQFFTYVNGFLVQAGREPLFEPRLVGLARETRQTTGLFTVNPDMLIGEVSRTDLIIVPAIHGDPHQALADNEEFIPWILHQHGQGAEVASFCVGAFFLAFTGLLDGKPCATHWMQANNFRRMFPQVDLVDDKIMTDAQGIYTSGGAYAYLNLLLYLIEKYAGREIAVLAAKTFMIDIDRSSQSPFMIFQGQRQHDDEEVRRAQDYIERHYQGRITVDELAAIVTVGRRNLERRFKKATANTVIEYIQRVRIEAAKKSLETGRKTINELMYEVGYSDTKAFRTTFRRITGLSPQGYRNKYHKESASLSGAISR